MTKTKDDFKIKGSFIATLRHKDGSVEVRRKDNLILNGGFDFILITKDNELYYSSGIKDDIQVLYPFEAIYNVSGAP